jgi:hypothetical protein
VPIFLARFLFKQVMQVSTFLMWTEEGDGDFAAGANLAFQAFADFSQGKVAAEMRSQSGEAETRGVQTGCTRAPVVIVVGDVFQCACLESGVFHICHR